MTFFVSFEVHKDGKPDRTETIEGGIPQNYVLSRSLDGTPLSTFADNTWDFTPYGAQSKWSFDSWNKGERDELHLILQEEIKTILWLSMFNPSLNSSRAGGINSFSSRVTLLRALANMAYRLNTSLLIAAESPQFQVALRSSITSATHTRAFSGPQASPLSLLLRDLHSMAHQDDIALNIKLPIIVPESSMEDLLILARRSYHEAEDNRKQTPLIPTRILANLISGCEKKLSEIEPLLKNILDFVDGIKSNPLLWCDDGLNYQSNLKRINSKQTATWGALKESAVGKEETVERYELTGFFKKWNINDLKSFQAVLKKHQLLASILVHAYTGMRKSEIKVMPYKSYIEHEVPHFGKVGFIVSHLKKFSVDNYSEALLWVTGGPIESIIKISQKISRIKWRYATNDPFIESQSPLWPSNSARKTKNANHYGCSLADLSQYTEWKKGESCSLLADIDGIIIESSDMDELMAFDAFRNWDEDPRFEVGNIWPLSTHQFRRSVAVYASRSGMVSLPSLGTQYKHLSKAMTALYAENSSFAQAFVLEDGAVPKEYGILAEFQRAQAFNTSVIFHEKVIAAESKLSGGRGTEIQINKDRNALPKIMKTREWTEKAVRDGRMAYRETVVGGCMEKDICDKYGIDEVLPCIFQCSDSIVGGDSGKKLVIYAKGLEMGLDDMDKGSLAYKATQKELELIKVKLLDEEDVIL